MTPVGITALELYGGTEKTARARFGGGEARFFEMRLLRGERDKTGAQPPVNEEESRAKELAWIEDMEERRLRGRFGEDERRAVQDRGLWQPLETHHQSQRPVPPTRRTRSQNQTPSSGHSSPGRHTRGQCSGQGTAGETKPLPTLQSPNAVSETRLH